VVLLDREKRERTRDVRQIKGGGEGWVKGRRRVLRRVGVEGRATSTWRCGGGAAKRRHCDAASRWVGGAARFLGRIDEREHEGGDRAVGWDRRYRHRGEATDQGVVNDTTVFDILVDR
jgi:hypothetical protein